MTVQEYTDRLKAVYGLVGEDLTEVVILPAARVLLESIKKRVVNTGKGTEGNDIGKYSTKPVYVERDKFIKSGAFNPQGKNNVFGNTLGDRIIPSARLKTSNLKANKRTAIVNTLVKPDYTERKTMYLKEGYKELRDIQGLRTDVMNLKYSGQLVNDYQLQKVAQEVLLGITTDRSSKIYQGLTDRFGDFYQASPAEQDEYINMVNYSLQRITRNTIEGYNVTATIS